MAAKERSTERKRRVGAYLAKRRVARGVLWLRRHAQRGWHRNLFNVFPSGTASFRAHDSYDNECVLALAFEHEAALANSMGYVTFGSVSNYFGLSKRDCIRLGFCTSGVVTPEVLDEAWKAAALACPTMVHRHETAVDQSFRGSLPKRAASSTDG